MTQDMDTVFLYEIDVMEPFTPLESDVDMLIDYTLNNLTPLTLDDLDLLLDDVQLDPCT